MNPHRTCKTCIHNQGNTCANEASRYHGASLKAWNTCGAYQAPMPSAAELIARLDTCATAFDHRAAKAEGEYKPYFSDRAAQCRAWAADVKEGYRTDLDYITGGLVEFEGLAL